jgi:hypothetical protein
VLSQILGAIAVFATLAYLAVQVRHAREETRRAISQSRAETLRQLLMTDATDEHLGGIRSKASTMPDGAFASGAGLALMQRTGITSEEATALSVREFEWSQYRAQVIRKLYELAPGDRIAFDVVARGVYSSSLGGLWFEATKPFLDPDAVGYVGKLIAQAG